MTKLEHRVVAHNDATDSGNPMHDDAAARALNFKGALVPGVTVYGYMTHNLVEHFGEGWLDTGCMAVRFRRPVYVDDQLTIALTNTDREGVVDVTATNTDGEVCVLGTGSMALHGDDIAGLIENPVAPYKTLPSPRWPATAEQFEQEQVLGTFTAAFSSNIAARFLDDMQDDQAIYRTGITHPSWLLRQANLVVDRNFDLGPWIHVESELKNFARLDNDCEIQVRAQLMALFERKGHQYADLDIAMVLASDPQHLVMRVMHRFIYRVAGSQNAA